MQFKNGDIYEGSWVDGQFEGQGLYLYSKNQALLEESPTFSQFRGIYKEGRRLEGELRYENGDIYYGTFNEEGMKECGVQKYENGDEYSGEFKEGARSHGVMKFKSGEEYSGEWKNGLFHGSGKINYENGIVYKGEFQNGNKHG